MSLANFIFFLVGRGVKIYFWAQTFFYFFCEGRWSKSIFGPQNKKIKNFPDFLRFFSPIFSGLTELTTVCEPEVTAQN